MEEVAFRNVTKINLEISLVIVSVQLVKATKFVKLNVILHVETTKSEILIHAIANALKVSKMLEEIACKIAARMRFGLHKRIVIALQIAAMKLAMNPALLSVEQIK